MSESTVETQNTQLPALPDDSEIAKIRATGAAEIAYRKEVSILERQIAGMEWGGGNQVVRGSSFSPHTRYALAQFCRITRANPLTQVDILGGRPYLNANYWEDRINSDPLHHHHEQREISERSEQALRDLAAKKIQRAGEGADTYSLELKAEARALEAQADELALARIHWSPPGWATHVYETTVCRFINSAPMDAIRKGEIQDIDPYLVEVRECNWAGGRPPGKTSAGKEYNADPVGNAEPEKTARTRSLRRAAKKAFPAWMDRYEEQIQKAEQAIDAEWEEVQDRTNGRREQAVLESGAAGEVEGALELPGTVEPSPVETTAEPLSDAEELKERSEARKRYFATLHEAGIDEKARKKWQEEMDLPISTKDFSGADFDRAVESLIGPARIQYGVGCEALGFDPEDFALHNIGKLPEWLSDYNKLNAKLDSLAESDQRELGVAS